MCTTVEVENVLQQLKADRLTSFSREGHLALVYLQLHIARVILDEKGKVLAADEKRDLEFLIKNRGDWTIADKSQIPQWSYSLKSIWKFDHELKMFVWKKTKILGQIQILLQWYRAYNLPDSLLGGYRLSIAEGLMRKINNSPVEYAKLEFFAYGIGHVSSERQQWSTYDELMSFLESCGFDIPFHGKVCNTPEEVKQYVDMVRGKKHELPVNIDGVGMKMAKSLANQYKNLDSLRKATVDELLECDGVGYKAASSIAAFFFYDEMNSDMLDVFKDIGLWPTQDK